MATTVDDLIDLKDQAVAACHAAVAAWETGDFADAFDMNTCRDVIERAELYDTAEECDEAVSIEDFEEMQAKERATCSKCLARTYRGEECVCPDGGDAEDYDEARGA